MPAPNDLDYYLNKIASEHNKPDFMAVVMAVVSPLVALQPLLLSLQTLFDIDNATGAQLDQIGQWLNRNRFVDTPIDGVYFSLDDPLLGLNQGIWYSPYSPLTGLVELDDDHYRLLLRAKIAANMWDGTLPDATRVLETLIQAPIGDPAQTFIFYQTNNDDEVYIGLSGKLLPPLAQSLITKGYIRLAAMGVTTVYAQTSVDQSPVFGLDVDNKYISGLDQSAWATLSF